MNIVQEKVDALNALAKVELKREDYEPKLNAALRDYSKKVDLKGFRKGKIPMSLIKKMYGNSVLIEEINRMINAELNEFLKTEKIEILGHPIPQADQNIELDINNLNDYEFVYELGLVPEFNIDFTDGTHKFDRLDVEVEDKQIDQEIENLQLRHGDVSNPDDIKLKDIVSVEFIELDDQGEPKEGGINHNAAVTTDMAKDEFFKKLSSCKKDDQFNWEITNIYDREKADFLKNVLEFQGNEAEVNNTFQLKVLNVNRLGKAAINADFFKKAFPNGDVKSLDELKAHITSQLKDYLSQQAEIKLENDMFDRLLNKTEIPLPEPFLKKWIKATNEKPITDEQIEDDFDKVTRDIKWSLIENKLSQEYDIKIEAEEVREETRIQLLNQMAQYGMGMMDEERTSEFVENMMKRDDHVRQTAGRIMQKKLFGALKEKVDIQEKKVKLDTFKELIATEKK